MNTDGHDVCVDAEVHLLPPEWCTPDFSPPESERVMRRVVYEHPEREAALRGAHAEGLLEEMARSGVDRAVVMGLPWLDPELCERNNLYVSEVVKRHPQRFVGMAVLPGPRERVGRDAVSRAVEELGLSGVKVIPSWQGWRLDDSAFEPALERLEELGAVLVPHTDHMITDPATGDPAFALLQVARRHAGLRILAPHLGGLLCLYRMYEPLSAALDNILFVSSVPRTMGMVLMAVGVAGAEGVAFGTDHPFNPSHDQGALRQALEDLPLSADQHRQVAGASVLQFLEGVPCAW